MNERIATISAILPTIETTSLDEHLRKDADYQAVYCLTEELLKIYAEQDLTDLSYLGKWNLQTAISHWRYELRQNTRELRSTDKLMEFLDKHSTKESLDEHAKMFTGVDASYGRKYDAEIMAYVPTNPEASKRKRNTSTLNVCGWCKFCHEGWARGDCKLTCHCELIPTEHEQLNFDTPCLFRRLVSEKPSIVHEKMVKLGRTKYALLARKRDLLKRISLLTKLREAAEDKPAFPCCTLSAKFNDGERVIVMTNEPKKQKPETGAMPLYRGTVIPSKYQHRSFANHPKLVYGDYDSFMAHMCASIQMSNYPAIQLDEEAGWSKPYYAVGSALSISEKDFEYLCAHEEYRKLWLAGLGENVSWVRATWTDAFERASV